MSDLLPKTKRIEDLRINKDKPLSEKEVLIHVEMGKSDTLFDGTKCAGMMIHSSYVKEAVEKLKEELVERQEEFCCEAKQKSYWFDDRIVIKIIDKIFGEI